MEPDDRELKALIRLLDDPDQTIYADVSQRLVSIGPPAIPLLESEFFDTLPDVLTQERIQDIIHRIEFDLCRGSIADWVSCGAEDLLEGSLIMARYQYPDLDEAQIRTTLNRIRKDIWLELNERLTALEKVRVMNHLLFDVHGFSGNSKDFHSPQNSFINVVTESKKGNPLSLSIIYLHIAQQLGLPIVGFNLPELFILGYKDELDPDPRAMLFYINPFGRGAIFGLQELEAFIRRTGTEPTPELRTPCNHADIIGRMSNNLLNSYLKFGANEKADEIRELQKAIEQNIRKEN